MEFIDLHSIFKDIPWDRQNSNYTDPKWKLYIVFKSIYFRGYFFSVIESDVSEKNIGWKS